MADSMIELSQCPVCVSPRISHWFDGFTNRDPSDGVTWPVFRCAACGHGFMNPQPCAAILDRYYTAKYTAYNPHHGADADDARAIADARQSGEFRHAPISSGKRVLDLGCGGGYFLSICRQLGAEVFGIEPSAYGYDITAQQNIPVFHGDLAAYLASHGGTRFDVITANHVLEHIPDPVRALAGLKTLLAPGGTIVITVPNARSRFAEQLRTVWYNTDLPFHLHQFSAQSLTKAAELAGLAVNEMSTTSLPHATAASFSQLMRCKYYIPGKLTHRLLSVSRAVAMAKKDDARGQGEALLARFG